MQESISHGTRSNGFVNRRSPVQSREPAPSTLRPVPPHRKPFPHPSIPGAMVVPITKGRFAVIDECDAEAIGRNWWCIHSTGRYATMGGGGILLHRRVWLLAGGGETPAIDHIDRDGLNCRRSNLRAATPATNAVNAKIRRDNRSGLKGVTKVGPRHWRGQIRIGRSNVYLGTFPSPEEAHAAFMKAATARYGEFARAS